MTDANLIILPLVLLLVSAASGQEFGLLNPAMEFASCQPEEQLPSVRSDIECLTSAAPRALVTVFRTDTATCSRIARCDLMTLSDAPVVRPGSNKIFHQPVRRLLFAVKAGSGVNANSSYASSANCNNSMLLLPYGQAPTVQLWRSCWLDRLPELMRRTSLTSLVLHVIKDGSDVINITFNAIFDGLDAWNWFAKEKVVSYWPASLSIPSTTFNVFSIQGVIINADARSFHINMVYATCTNDVGYLVVFDTSSGCAWASVATATPKILFNVDGSKTWTLGKAAADYLAISVQ